MIRYIAKRLLLAIPTVFGIITLVFAMVHFLPGDPARLLAGDLATAEDVELIRHQLGLDKPIYIQYFTYLSNVLRLDLGTSIRTGLPVTEFIAVSLPVTIVLAVVSMAISATLGILGGVISSTRTYSKIDYGITIISLFGISMPIYWLGLMVIILFAVYLKVLPSGGWGTLDTLILPSVTLAVWNMGIITRMTRATMIEVLEQDYIRTARSKGVHPRSVVYKHALQNALLPIITITGLQFGLLLSGAVLTETVFAIPGMGRLLVNAIFTRDYPTIQGAILIFGFIVILVNLFTDLIYAYIDPRIHYE